MGGAHQGTCRCSAASLRAAPRHRPRLRLRQRHRKRRRGALRGGFGGSGGCADRRPCRPPAPRQVPNELADRLPLAGRDDLLALEQVAEPAALDQHSRLASKVLLSKELNGALIAIAPK